MQVYRFSGWSYRYPDKAVTFFGECTSHQVESELEEQVLKEPVKYSKFAFQVYVYSLSQVTVLHSKLPLGVRSGGSSSSDSCIYTTTPDLSQSRRGKLLQQN